MHLTNKNEKSQCEKYSYKQPHIIEITESTEMINLTITMNNETIPIYNVVKEDFPLRKFLPAVYTSEERETFFETFPTLVMPYLEFFNFPGLRGGFSFLKTFQQCQRKWFFKYILNFEAEPRNEMKLGSVVHDLIRSWLNKEFDMSALDTVFDNALKEHNLVDVEFSNLAWELFETWLNLRGQETLTSFDILYAGKGMLTLPLKNNLFVYIWKPDYILKHRASNIVFLMETKVTNFRTDKITQNVISAYQATSYAYTWNALNPNLKIDLCLPEVIKYKKLKAGPVFDSIHVENGTATSAYKFKLFERSLNALVYSIQQRKETFDMCNDPLLYQPSFGCCEGSHFDCKFMKICDKKFDVGDDVPQGFRKRDRRKEF